MRDEVSAPTATPDRFARCRRGLGTPSAVASLWARCGVRAEVNNQAAIESGLATEGKLLAKAGLADVNMAPAADMFELGVKVQVLKRALFGPRASSSTISTLL